MLFFAWFSCYWVLLPYGWWFGAWLSNVGYRTCFTVSISYNKLMEDYGLSLYQHDSHTGVTALMLVLNNHYSNIHNPLISTGHELCVCSCKVLGFKSRYHSHYYAGHVSQPQEARRQEMNVIQHQIIPLQESERMLATRYGMAEDFDSVEVFSEGQKTGICRNWIRLNELRLRLAGLRLSTRAYAVTPPCKLRKAMIIASRIEPSEHSRKPPEPSCSRASALVIQNLQVLTTALKEKANYSRKSVGYRRVDS
ncbi:uncharacterized protein EV420DRAFT_1754592 [Desarmillaria tabescens]|uniref:Uncharacterized protein n=1 Tax=Armillaria tabescens TaxID=1929756 RepID=A0AA39J3I6_ARMTA|nr:uncharacterized protein EV420DRAFT_1754592 [Desarmillaria tabescens]KAK0434169.1 hypothetical protein EV420DRAFT_1754592 [Desarmillaria tabescens]